ncbi:hypothetical protein K431DRAFT_321000 [Polychaeton citri CBS 116435]|uniref:Uncharacterized protein n=1 Tax=Polychaeton citri CBS 116435 TaxID=1314669 RepID=A0A9P4Q4G8_9PEZI|nr:hypothetical protein K431DRAFT_321000 [Polychaeton citri CBS 116435]
MAYSLYDATVVMARSALTSLDSILVQAEKHSNAAGLLTLQVHYAVSEAEAVAANLSGQEYEEPSEDLDSYEKMHARIENAPKELGKTKKETANRVPVKALVCSKHMPNIYFHVGITYAILRIEGVALEKRD